jgi:hypothetical protein
MDGSFPVNFVIGIVEVPFLLILVVLGLAAYLKGKDTAVKYAIIAFPVIMFLNLLALIVSEIFPHTDSVQKLLEPANGILTIVVFIGCLVAFETGLRWYLKSKGTVVLCLAISFGLYALSGLLIFLNNYFAIYKDGIVPLAALITGLAAYMAGIAAMIVALVRPKQRQAVTSE